MVKNNWKVSPSPAVKKREWINKRTGEVMKVPEGIDPGFDFNPGKNRRQAMDKFMKGKLREADPMIRKVAEKDLADYRRAQGT